MTWFHTLSIRSKLLIMALIIALPAFGIIFQTGFHQRADAIREANRATERICDAITTEHQHLVAATQQLGNAISLLPEVQTRNAARLQPLLADILRLNPQYLNILVADLSGMAWASALPAAKPFSIADRRYYKNLIKTGQFSSGEFIIGKIRPRPVFSFSYPIKDATGKLSGLVILSINLEHVEHLLHGVNQTILANVTLSDHQGTVLFRKRAHHPGDINSSGIADVTPLFKRMQSGPARDSFIETGLDGVKRFITYQKLQLQGEQTHYLYIRTGIPVKAALQASNRALALNISVMVLFVLAALGLAWLYSTHNIVHRIARLDEASQQLANGKLETRILDQINSDELGELSRSFNRMATQIAQRELEQKQAEHYLRINESRLAEAEALAHLGNFSWDLVINELTWSDEMFRLFGYKPWSLPVTPELFLKSIHAEDREQLVVLLNNMASYSDYAEYDYRVCWPDGTIRYLQGRSTVIRDDNGIAVRMQGTAQDITEQVKVQQKLIEYQETLLALTDELSQAGERERQRIAAELHDNIAQTLALCSIRLSAPNLDSVSNEQRQEIKLIKSRLDSSIETIRGMITRLSPPVLHEMGLESALEWLLHTMEEEWGLHVTFTCDQLPESISPDLSISIFQIIRELLTNTAKHAATNQAWLTLKRDHNRLIICVADHGNGFDQQQTTKGFGLFSIHQKMHFLKGDCTIESVPGEGTQTTLSIPLTTT